MPSDSTDSKIPIRYDLLDPLLAKIDESIIPSEPPFPPVRLSSGNPDSIRVAVYLADDILRYAIFLTEKSLESRGDYLKGVEAPDSSVAYSTGAIILSFTAFENFLNETISIHSKYNIKRGDLELRVNDYMKMDLLPRFEELMKKFYIAVDWTVEPYSSLKLLHKVRNSLVHRGKKSVVSAADGFFPNQELKALARKVNSPYEDEGAPHHWYTHALTPNGAAWSLNTILEVFTLINTELRREVGK